MSILEVNNVSKSFGGVKANVDISMSVEKGKIVGLIGPNGSWKTTLFNSIVGTYPIDNGSIKFNGQEVSELPVPVIAKLGLLRTFQQTRIYGKLNCVDNMLISHKGSDESLLKIFSKIPKDLTDKAENLLKHIKLITEKYKIEKFFNISAKKKLGFENLIDYLLQKSKYGRWLYKDDEITDKDDIFITNECTRNEILSLIHKEIPYNIEVTNKKFKYLKNGQLKIKQDIIIKNDRYKKILLGRKGSKIKDIRIKSQKEISNILDVKTHLYINIISSDAKKI